jgi:hypothetical protein
MTEKTIVSAIMEELNVSIKDAEKVLEKAKAGGEITPSFTDKQWLDERFLPNCVSIDENGYARMCIDALKVLGSTAATDYGSSRQRDLGQLWADMTRGYLGEYAFQLFLRNRWNIQIELGHEQGNLEDYLSTDVHRIKEEGQDYRKTKLNVSIKTTKWNGIWLDIPGDQFSHSDVHVLVKVGAGRDHLFAFFKDISVFRDKILKRGEDINVLTREESIEIFNELPSFAPIPSYICGFVFRDDHYKELPYSGKMGRKNYTITGWKGLIDYGDIERIKQKENVSGKVQFTGIGSFSHEKGYLFNTGNLLWHDEDWQKVCSTL